MDGAVHVTLRRKVHNRDRTAPLQEIADKLSINNISVDEAVARVRGNRGQIAEIPGIGKLIHVHNWSAFGRKPLHDEIGADKAGSSGHENGLVIHLGIS
jgi:hypothetical protein